MDHEVKSQQKLLLERAALFHSSLYLHMFTSIKLWLHPKYFTNILFSTTNSSRGSSE